MATIYLAGGCFWGVEKYMASVRGVLNAEAGYANGTTESPTYRDVVKGDTGYTETVRVDYDPEVAPLPFLLELFYEAIDPTRSTGKATTWAPSIAAASITPTLRTARSSNARSRNSRSNTTCRSSSRPSRSQATHRPRSTTRTTWTRPPGDTATSTLPSLKRLRAQLRTRLTSSNRPVACYTQGTLDLEIAPVLPRLGHLAPPASAPLATHQTDADAPSDPRAAIQEPPGWGPAGPGSLMSSALHSGTRNPRAHAPTAVVYCEANFGAIDGKTANGLVRHSEKYEILSVIDSEKSGLDAGEALGEKPNGIPVCADLAGAIESAGSVPDVFIFGIAPASGLLSVHERGVVLEAMGRGMDIVSGLHEFLGDDPVFVAAQAEYGVTIRDVRRPRDKKDLRLFDGSISTVACPRIAILGTDCAIGKRTTATILTRALNERGIKAVMVTTGQTGLIQGARYGVALDAMPSQFCAGEMEGAVVRAFEAEEPDVIIVEGQSALGHPAFLSSGFILRGSQPQGVILQHAPARRTRCDFDDLRIPSPATEINLIETFADTKVIGLTINHENMTDAEVTAAIVFYEIELGIPATDALTRSPDILVQMVLKAFPKLRPNHAAARAVTAADSSRNVRRVVPVWRVRTPARR
jgi:uncharacterized NAD-dependent epimerase/dehydratase family protein